MEAYRTSVTVHDDGTVIIGGLPFRKGQRLDVILLEQTIDRGEDASYSLRGEPVEYGGPFDSVAEDDWDSVN